MLLWQMIILEVCVGGSMPIMNETSARPYDCSLALQRYCPVGYHCEGFDQRLSRNGICCPKRITSSKWDFLIKLVKICSIRCLGQACPYGQKGFTNPMTGFVQFCHVRSEHACPMGFRCFKHNPASQDEIGVCCRDPAGAVVDMSTATTTTTRPTTTTVERTTPTTTTATSTTTISTTSTTTSTAQPNISSTPNSSLKNNRPPLTSWQSNRSRYYGTHEHFLSAS